MIVLESGMKNNKIGEVLEQVLSDSPELDRLEHESVVTAKSVPSARGTVSNGVCLDQGQTSGSWFSEKLSEPRDCADPLEPITDFAFIPVLHSASTKISPLFSSYLEGYCRYYKYRRAQK